MFDFTSLDDQVLQQKLGDFVTDSHQMELQIIAATSEISRRSIHLRLGHSSIKSYLETEHHMSEDQAGKRSQVVNLIHFHPKFFDLLATRQTYLSHLAMCASRVTEKNADKFLDFLPRKSKRDVLFFLARITPDGDFVSEVEPKVELKIRCTEETLVLFERARKLIAKSWRGASNDEVLRAAIEVLLDKRDPMRKAQRAQARLEKKNAKQDQAGASKPDREAESGSSDLSECAGASARGGEAESGSSDLSECAGASQQSHAEFSMPRALGAGRHVPNRVRYQVYLRDGGRCTYVGINGRRCNETISISLDHLCLFSRGGAHTVENLSTTCISHNNLLAIDALGSEKMSRYLKRISLKSERAES